MAAPASKNRSSCSSIKPSNQRSSEVINPMRRSFSGNPFAKPSVTTNQRPGFHPNTPVNSPSDCPRRYSIGRENIIVTLREAEDKENCKDQSLKRVNVRSPAFSKGAKHFMSPTISATSKINASPVKKILTERNEPIRSSVSFSDGKMKEDLDTKPERGLNLKKEVSFDPKITYLEDKENLKNDEDFDSVVCLRTEDDLNESVVTIGNDSVNLDPSFNTSPRNSCSLPIPALAPIDADPSMPPYDPKTNYLSPRPQFLHYKPNPRFEVYLNKERNGKQLEEIFASESSSDAEVAEEEEETQSVDGSVKESEGSSSGDVMKEEEGPEIELEEEEEDGEDELLISEPNSISTSKVAVPAERVSKQKFFTRTKFITLLCVLAIACLSASVGNLPVMNPSGLNDLGFSNLYVPHEISEFTWDNLEGLAQKFQQYFYNSLSYIHSLIISSKERYIPGPLQFANLSSLLEDGLVDNDFLLVSHSIFKYDSNELVPRKKGEIDTKSLKEQAVQPDVNVEEVTDVKLMGKQKDLSIEADETIEEVVEDIKEDKNIQEQDFEHKELTAEDDCFQMSVSEFKEVTVTLQDEPTKLGNLATEVAQDQEMVENPVYMGEPQNDSDVIDQPVPFLEGAEIQTEVYDSWDSLAKIESIVADNKLERMYADVAIRSSQSSELVNRTPPNGNMGLVSVQAIMGISLLVLSLLAAVAFIYAKNQTSTTFYKMPPAKELNHSPLSVTTGCSFQENAPSSIGESCPSEMSSFQYSSSSYSSRQRLKGMANEAHSKETRPRKSSRRESMASSDCSMGSPSYGSFTTYEKITNKHHGNGEEKLLTPVRRSSRIRNQATSP